MLTLEERERRAYVSNCPTRFALAEAIDQREVDATREDVKERDNEIDGLRAEISDLEEENVSLAAEVKRLNIEVDNLQPLA